MSRAVMQISFVALLAEPVAETGWSKWAPKLCDQESQVSRWGCGDGGLKSGMERDINVDRRAVLVLCLPELKATISDVLRTQPHCIFPAAACIDEEVESQ